MLWSASLLAASVAPIRCPSLSGSPHRTVRVILDHEQSSLGPGPHAPKWARWLSRQDQPRGLVDVIADEARSCLSEAAFCVFWTLCDHSMTWATGYICISICIAFALVQMLRCISRDVWRYIINNRCLQGRSRYLPIDLRRTPGQPMPPPNPNEWQQLRAAVHREAQAVIRVPDLRLTEIDATALRVAGDWRPAGSRRRLELARPYTSSGASINTAIWHRDRLCGLMCGSAGAAAVVLRYLEGAPDPTHPLKGRVADIGVATAEVYARALGAPTVLLNDPISALVDRLGAGPGYAWMTEAPFQGYFGRKVIP